MGLSYQFGFRLGSGSELEHGSEPCMVSQFSRVSGASKQWPEVEEQIRRVFGDN